MKYARHVLSLPWHSPPTHAVIYVCWLTYALYPIPLTRYQSVCCVSSSSLSRRVFYQLSESERCKESNNSRFTSFTNSQPPTALNSLCDKWTLIAVIGYLSTSTICELWVWFFPFGFLCPTWRGFYPLEVINKERTHLISWRSHLLKTFHSPTRTIY